MCALKTIVCQVATAAVANLNGYFPQRAIALSIPCNIEQSTYAGADEAILRNSAGRIAEGSTDNIFIVQRGELLTPPVIEGTLDSITRSVVLELARKLGIKAREIPLAPYDLFTADECFLTGTGAELIPVGYADGRKIPECPGPIYLQLATAFRELVSQEV